MAVIGYNVNLGVLLGIIQGEFLTNLPGSFAYLGSKAERMADGSEQLTIYLDDTAGPAGAEGYAAICIALTIAERKDGDEGQRSANRDE